jgi:hypothetical protein
MIQGCRFRALRSSLRLNDMGGRRRPIGRHGTVDIGRLGSPFPDRRGGFARLRRHSCRRSETNIVVAIAISGGVWGEASSVTHRADTASTCDFVEWLVALLGRGRVNVAGGPRLARSGGLGSVAVSARGRHRLRG